MKMSAARKLMNYFKVFYASIAGNPAVNVQTVYEQYSLDRRHSKCVNVAIRHDVDLALDLVLPLAEYERGLGIRSSYYFLTRTAPYDLWNSDVPKKIAQMGHEVGLHSDHGYEAAALQADGLERIREDVKRLSELAGTKVKGMVWHGGKHMKALGAHNYDLYEKIPPADLGLVYHDASLYHPGTRKWKCAYLLSDSENNLRFVPGKINHVLKSAKPGEDLLMISHPCNMFRNGLNVPARFPDFPHLSPPLQRTLVMDLRSMIAYNKAYLGDRKVRWARRLIGVLEKFDRPKVTNAV